MTNLIKNYLDYYLKINDNQGTKKYNNILYNYLLKYFSFKNDADFDIYDFITFYKDNTSLSNKSINKLIKLLRQVYLHYDLKHSKLFSFKLLKENHTSFDMFTKSELKLIFDYLDGYKSKSTGFIYVMMIYLLYDTGLRPNELFNLKTANVYVNDRCIYVDKTKTAVPRFVFMSQLVTNKLNDYLKLINHEYLFFNIDKNRLFNLNDFKNFFRHLKNKTGIKKAHAYMFRHTYITDIIDLEVPLNIVQQQAGHAKLTTTMIYYHKSTKMQKKYITNIKRQ